MHRHTGSGWKQAAREGAFRALLLLPLGISLAAALPGYAQTAAKTIEGKVLDHGTAPLPGSIIYLQDAKTNVVKTFIATADGTYRFGQLPADTDYKIWAVSKGEKSKTKLISSFDTKLNVTLDFHIGK